MMSRADDHKGFTLIEIILTIVLVAMLGAATLAFLGSGLTRSVNPVILVKDQNELIDVMEKIVAEYRDQIEQDNLDLGTFPATAATYLGTDMTLSSAYIAFADNDNNGTYDEASCTYGSSGCTTLRITLVKGDQRTSSLFTE